jgi:hypothetical protein
MSGTKLLPRLLLAGLALARAGIAAPLSVNLEPRQGLMSAKPFVGSPWGDWYRSTDTVQCEPLSITFGGGEGAPYAISIVEPPASPNVSASEVVVLERVGVLGMPGYTYYSIDGSDLKVGTAVALQITDRAGQVAYSVNRHGVLRLAVAFSHRTPLLTLPCYSRGRSPQRVLPVRVQTPLSLCHTDD